MQEWFAIRAKPHKEMLAAENFKRQGFTCYLPTVIKGVRHARQTRVVIRPFFPGYLFLLLDDHERDWHTIGNTRGALGPVKFGDSYPPVPSEIIGELQAKEDELGRIALPDPVSRLKPGQQVTVQGFSEEGVLGKFIGLRGQDRAVVLVDLLKRQVSTTVPVSSLSVA